MYHLFQFVSYQTSRTPLYYYFRNEADLDNGLMSFVRRRSRSIGDDDSSSIYTENTDKRASNASMLPRHMWAQPRSKISNAIAKFYKSDPEPRRASVCESKFLENLDISQMLKT